MRIANIITGVIIALWIGLFYMGRSLMYGVYAQGKDIYPSAGQIDYYVIFPICVAVVLVMAGWVCNTFLLRRSLIALSIISFGVMIAYLLPYTGGV